MTELAQIQVAPKTSELPDLHPQNALSETRGNNVTGHANDSQNLENDSGLTPPVPNIHPPSNPLAASLANQKTPIYSLPIELLVEIFKTASYTPSPTNPPHFPISISHTTHHWRTVALATPTLWTGILIRASSQSQSRSTERVATYLKRSRSTLLDVALEIDSNEEPVATIERHLPLLFPHLSRWRRLSVACSEDHAHLRQILTHLQFKCAPSLQHLIVRCHISRQFMTDEFLLDIFLAGAPALTTAEFHGLSINSCYPPLKAITTLRLAGFRRRLGMLDTYEELHNLLEAFPSLAELSLSQAVFHPLCFILTRLRPVHLPQIRRLSIAQPLVQGFVMPLCGAMLTPGVERLDLRELGGLDTIGFASLVRGKPARYPAVRTLELYKIKLYSVAALDLIHGLPDIHHFISLIRSPDSDIIFHHLLDSEDTLWPHLTTITALDVFNNGDSIELLVALISSRSTGTRGRGPGITKVRLNALNRNTRRLSDRWLGSLRGMVELEWYSHLD